MCERETFLTISLLLIFIGVLIGVITVVIGAQTDFDFETVTCSNNMTLGDVVRTGDNYIGLTFTTCPNDRVYDAFVRAADRWSGIITENNIRTERIGGNGIVGQSACSFLDNNVKVSGDFDLDYLLIFVDLTFIDGSGGILGQAGPCVRDGSQNDFPVIAGITIEKADLVNIPFDTTLDALVMHEMAHTLGFGLSWQSSGLLQDPVFPTTSTSNPGAQPRFTGNQAIQEYSRLVGDFTNFVPVEDGIRNDRQFFDPLELGRGSLDLHWKIDTFGEELMVFAFRTDGREYPLSALTIASIGDLGYSVNTSLADEYTLPSSASLVDQSDDNSELLRVEVVRVEQKSISIFA